VPPASNHYIHKGQPGFWRAGSALFAGAVVTYALLYSVQPILPTLSADFAVSPTVASLTLAFSTGALAVCLPIMASLSEAVGRKHLMAFAMAASVALAFATAGSSDFPLLLVWRLLQGVALAGLPAVAMAYVAEEFSPQSTGAFMGFYVSSSTIGGLSGRILTGTVTDAASWRVAILLLAAMGAAATLWFIVALPRERHFQRQPAAFDTLFRGSYAHLREPGLLCLFLTAFLLMGSFFTLYDYLPYLLVAAPYRLSQAAIGWLFLLNLTGTASSLLMGRLADRWGRRPVLPLCILIMMAGMLLTLVPALPIKLMGVAVTALGFTGAHSVASGWVVLRATRHRAQASALYLLFFYAGTSVIGTLGGVFWTHLGWPGVVGLLMALVAAALILSGVLVRLGPLPRPARLT